MKKKTSFLIIILILLSICSIFIGSVDIDFFNLEQRDLMILSKIRYPRIILAIISGAVLALNGLIMQTFTENDLAEPYILGIAQGASFGAVCSIIYGVFSIFGNLNVYIGSFIGAIVSILIVLLVIGKENDTIKLVLVGVGVGSMAQALTMFVIYSSKNEAQVRSAMFWLVGSLSGTSIKDVYMPLFVLVVNVVVFFKLSKELDLLLLGKKEVLYLGMPYEKIKYTLIFIMSFSTAVIVSKTGIIGFVGLIVPHITRRMVKSSHKQMIPITALNGAILLLISDNLSRWLFRPQEFPIGIITSLIGAPLFIYFLVRKK